MTDEVEHHEPNKYGFAGGATTPDPEPPVTSADDVHGEDVAVPAGDLTGAITHAIEDPLHHKNHDDE
ncbi:hypothetical protein [Mangrovihabitans endophyticus]|nr:hypothetical protein [Mangrovihabitans endophyticus]